MGYARCVWAMGRRRKTAVISLGNAHLPWYGWIPTCHPTIHPTISLAPCTLHPPQLRRGSTFKASKCICDKPGPSTTINPMYTLYPRGGRFSFHPTHANKTQCVLSSPQPMLVTCCQLLNSKESSSWRRSANVTLSWMYRLCTIFEASAYSGMRLLYHPGCLYLSKGVELVKGTYYSWCKETFDIWDE